MKLLNFSTRSFIDDHRELTHLRRGVLAEELRVRNAEDDLANLKSFFDQLDMLDLAVG